MVLYGYSPHGSAQWGSFGASRERVMARAPLILNLSIHGVACFGGEVLSRSIEHKPKPKRGKPVKCDVF